MTEERPDDTPLQAAPEWSVGQWFNTDGRPTLASLRGRVVMIEAFQMLCPGCVTHGVPLAQAVHRLFPQEQVAVIGLHTVFEHHAAMTAVSLAAFLHEYRVTFPVGIDEPGTGALPVTMARYGMRGTPSLILIDREGRLRAHHFGQVSELRLGAEIATLLAEAGPTPSGPSDRAHDRGPDAHHATGGRSGG